MPSNNRTILIAGMGTSPAVLPKSVTCIRKYGIIYNNRKS